MRFRAVPLLAIALLPLLVGFSKKPAFTISFHAEAEEMDMKKSMFPLQIEGRQMMFKIVPEFSQQNIVAFHPFDSETGDKGVAMQLDFRGRGALEMVTRTRRGQFLLAMVNGRPVDYVVLDQVIDNGFITIWRGVTEETIKGMDKKYPRIKPGGPPSVHPELDMQPATKKEKKKALKDSQEADKAEAKARKEGKPIKPEIPSLDAPRSPVSNSIPLEGNPGLPPVNPGAPANPAIPLVPPKATPAGEPALPRP